MGKSRGNRLSRNSQYWFWRGVQSLSGFQVYAVSDSTAFAAITDAYVKPKCVFGSVSAFYWGTNANLTTLPQLCIKVQNCYNMFSGLSKIKDVDLSRLKLDTTQIISYTSMFDGCTDLKRIIKFPIETKCAYYGNHEMFNGCTSLTEISFSEKSILSGQEAFDFSESPLNGQSLLNIAFILDPESTSKEVKFYESTSSQEVTKNVKLNAKGDGLEFCDAGDSGDLGTLAEYITNKGWTLTLV